MADKSIFLKIDHIGVVVRDLDRAVEHYESLGIGPFKPLPLTGSRVKKVMGKPIDVNSIQLKSRNAALGSVDFELLEPAVGESLWKEYLETHGEGINHIAFGVDDIESVEAKLVDEGFTMLYSSRFNEGGGDCYMDTDEIGGVIFTPVEWPAESKAGSAVTGESPLAKLGHIGMVVRDVDKTVEYYESLGLGPFEPPMQWVSNKKWVMGKPVPPDSIVNKERILRIGDSMVQIIEPVKGGELSLWQNHLDTKGEGVNHIAFHVKDIDKQQAMMEAKGLEVLFASRFTQGGGCAYIDTGKVGGVLVELIEWIDQ